MAQFSYVENDGFKNLTVLLDGELVSVTGDHPRFQEIFTKVVGDDVSDLKRLVDPAQAITERFEKVSTQVAIRNGHVLFEGDEVHDVITDQIVRFYEEGNDNFKPLVAFLEKLYQNPNEHSREHLYRWLSVHEIPIAPNGDFIAYKGVRNDLTSLHAGHGIVDGKEYFDTHLPNVPGSMVEMPRGEVTFDPADGCSFGLHAGTWSYANSFGNKTLEVHINPRDVVSVPVDCGDQKLRTCRYTVVQELERPYDSAYVGGEFDDEDYDEDDYDDDFDDEFDDEDDDFYDEVDEVDEDEEEDEPLDYGTRLNIYTRPYPGDSVF